MLYKAKTRTVKVGKLDVELYDLSVYTFIETPTVNPHLLLYRFENSERIKAALKQQGLDCVPDEQKAEVYGLRSLMSSTQESKT